MQVMSAAFITTHILPQKLNLRLLSSSTAEVATQSTEEIEAQHKEFF